ncbi:MAG: GNAT family N-acetyltransferase [Longimicrobiaceae bacterium]
MTAAAPVAPAADAVLGPSARWESAETPAAEWAARVARCGGSFFHAPPALGASLPAGEPLYATLRSGNEVLAVAAGVACGCRVSARPRHLRFAAFPATAPGVERAHAAELLARWLAGGGAAEVEIGSFASPCEGPPPRGALPGRARTEFVLPLCADASPLDGLGKTHRRHVAAGKRAGWRLRALDGAEAAGVLGRVQLEASRRATARGDGFAAGAFAAGSAPAAGLAAPWGVLTFAACDGDAPLAAARVGWGNQRAFYLVGGSTPEGYRQSAAAWLHASIATLLAGAGLTEYGLGGTPAEAADPGHPAHGLHRFKAGFGASAVACRGLRWEHAPAHLRAHRLLGRLTSLVSAGR